MCSRLETEKEKKKKTYIWTEEWRGVNINTTEIISAYQLTSRCQCFVSRERPQRSLLFCVPTFGNYLTGLGFLKCKSLKKSTTLHAYLD